MVLIGDGTGNFVSPAEVVYQSAVVNPPAGIVSADLNGDGLPELITGIGSAFTSNSNIDIEFDSAAAQAVLLSGNQAIPAGTHSLTAAYSGDANFAASTSLGFPEVVNKTVPAISWAGPGGTVEYGTLLSSAQLNAVANVPGIFAYNPGPQTLLPPGMDTITSTFTPTDTFDYAGVVSTLTITVGSPSLLSISPTSVPVGSSASTITATGLGFVTGAVITYNGTALATTYVDQHHLTAVLPASLLVAPTSGTIAVVDPGNLAATGTQPFSVVAPAPVATVSAAETTVTAGQQSTITLTVDAYPVPVTATATLVFTPAPPITVQDPAVVFSNNQTVEAISIAAGTTPSSTPFQFQAGSTAGSITVTIRLTLANGQDITPDNLVPITITVPASAPVLSSPTLTRSGQSLQITVIALSSTRDMTEAQFHFTAASGKSLKTTDITVSLTSVFQTWYGSAASDQYGTNFTYTQPFTLDGNATDVGSVTITLVNSAGTSAPATVQ